MKTLNELFQEIMSDKALKVKAVEAAKAGKLEVFLKEHGCGATLEEVSAFLKEKGDEDAPLSLNELENAAGGECNRQTTVETALSIVGIAGLICAGIAIKSLVDGKTGQEKPGDGRICNSMID